MAITIYSQSNSRSLNLLWQHFDNTEPVGSSMTAKRARSWNPCMQSSSLWESKLVDRCITIYDTVFQLFLTTSSRYCYWNSHRIYKKTRRYHLTKFWPDYHSIPNIHPTNGQLHSLHSFIISFNFNNVNSLFMASKSFGVKMDGNVPFI